MGNSLESKILESWALASLTVRVKGEWLSEDESEDKNWLLKKMLPQNI